MIGRPCEVLPLHATRIGEIGKIATRIGEIATLSAEDLRYDSAKNPENPGNIENPNPENPVRNGRSTRNVRKPGLPDPLHSSHTPRSSQHNRLVTDAVEKPNNHCRQATRLPKSRARSHGLWDDAAPRTERCEESASWLRTGSPAGLACMHHQYSCVQYKRWQWFGAHFSGVVVGERAIWDDSAWHGRNCNDLGRNGPVDKQ